MPGTQGTVYEKLVRTTWNTRREFNMFWLLAQYLLRSEANSGVDIFTVATLTILLSSTTDDSLCPTIANHDTLTHCTVERQ